MSKLRDAAQKALEALEKEPADYADWTRTMKAARAALRAALAEPAEQEPCGWQFYQDGKWHNSMDRNDHRRHTEEAGFPTRNVYPQPQPAKPAEQEPVAWCDQYEGHIDGLRHYSDGGAREIPLYTAPNLVRAQALEEAAGVTGEFAQKWWSMHCASNKHMETTRKAHDDFCALQAAIRKLKEKT